ncbi:MAG TPA: DUF559 domain-containing protein [Mesorhizobium sp.]|nr:DUF559 domain-containing protein [Mesorhizobium sp.]
MRAEGKALTPPPSRADARATSPPLRRVEDEPASALAPILHPAQRGGGADPTRSGGEAEGGTASTSRSRRKPGTTERARALRWQENAAEGLLWLELKGRKLGGYQFVRQLPVGPYFADFACRKRMLIVEVDGAQHANSTHDRRRDAFLASQGYSVVRFWNEDVLKQREAVCDTILAALDGRLSENVAAPDLRFLFAGRPERRDDFAAPPANPATPHQHPEPSP